MGERLAASVHRIADDALGNASYLVDLGGGLATVVDPRRDVDDYLELADRLAVRIVAVLETHLHADFVSGSRELAEATGAELVASAGGGTMLSHRGVAGGDELRWADTTVRVLATPGHTPEHVSYLLARNGEAGVFSGGSLIAGGAARTDLIAAERTDELTRAQYRSTRTLAALPDATALWPTHGAGSFCSSGPAVGGATTVGEQRRTNPLLAADDEDGFVRRLTSGYGSFPPYFLELRAVNQAGPVLVRDLAAPHPLSPAEVAEHVAQGAWLIDARPPGEWARSHPRGAVANPLRSSFASWLGWVVPFGTPVVLVLDEERVPVATVLARRIGYDSVLGWLDGGVEAWHEAGMAVDTVELVDAAEARRRMGGGATLLDVRQTAELADLRIPGAVHLELGDVIAGKAPEASEVVAFCGHGERSATAASLLERRGIRVAALDGGLGAWEGAGFPVER